jgi:hypothetical protein
MRRRRVRHHSSGGWSKYMCCSHRSYTCRSTCRRHASSSYTPIYSSPLLDGPRIFTRILSQDAGLLVRIDLVAHAENNRSIAKPRIR